MVAVIGSLPRTLEVFYRHTGPGASGVYALARLHVYQFDAVGPKGRLTPFCPIRGRTVICKRDGFFDGIGFNCPGQFSYFVRDDLESLLSKTAFSRRPFGQGKKPGGLALAA